MKKYAWMVVAMASVLFGILMWGTSSCDKIPEGERRTDAGEVVDSTWGGKYIVLEDFTGVKCVNCPGAAIIAKEVKKRYKTKLILIEQHPINSLTSPHPGDLDLRSPSAEVYYKYWVITGLPKGLINRQQAKGAPLGEAQWAAHCGTVYKEKAMAELSATAKLSPAGMIEVDAAGKITEDYTQEGELNLLMLVLEDSILVTQTAPEGNVKGYEHNHVSRGAMNGDWGAKVLDAKPKKGASFSGKASSEKKSDWKEDKLSVVVMLCNATTKEILQACQVEVSKK